MDLLIDLLYNNFSCVSEFVAIIWCLCVLLQLRLRLRFFNMFIGRENEYEKEDLEPQRIIFDITIITTTSISIRNPRKIISNIHMLFGMSLAMLTMNSFWVFMDTNFKYEGGFG